MNELAAQSTGNLAEQLAEHQLDWDRIRHRLTTLRPDHPTDSLGSFLTISRQAGTDGDAVARRVGDALGWAVLNGEIVDLMAELFDLEPHMLRLVDEARASWVRDVVTDFLPLNIIDRDTYVHHLGRVFHIAALHGEVVLVGRAANLFLPRNCGLSVRLVADEKRRVAHIGDREGLDGTRARKLATDLDHRRARLVRHYFGRDIDDPLLYDIVLNTTTLPVDHVADTIVDACRARGLDR
ncbi:MAG: cytidylate kinase-like family protein [Holophagae bacterium]|jgi:cytidylate kinase